MDGSSVLVRKDLLEHCEQIILAVEGEVALTIIVRSQLSNLCSSWSGCLTRLDHSPLSKTENLSAVRAEVDDVRTLDQWKALGLSEHFSEFLLAVRTKGRKVFPFHELERLLRHMRPPPWFP